MIPGTKDFPAIYVPPGRNIIGGRLLYENYEIYMKKTTVKLLEEA